MAYRTYTGALRAALSKVDAKPIDTAAVKLAQGYAKALDEGGDLSKLGPQLLQMLTALGMTPASRAAVTGKGGIRAQPAASSLDELRERRDARQHRTAAVDTAAR